MEDDNIVACPKCHKGWLLIDGILQCPDCGTISNYQPSPSYDQLLRENEQLKELLIEKEERIAHYEIDRI